MLFRQSSDGLPWYPGWAVFNVWVHVCLITSMAVENVIKLFISFEKPRIIGQKVDT
jgi:hypothetical protein